MILLLLAEGVLVILSGLSPVLEPLKMKDENEDGRFILEESLRWFMPEGEVKGTFGLPHAILKVNGLPDDMKRKSLNIIIPLR